MRTLLAGIVLGAVLLAPCLAQAQGIRAEAIEVRLFLANTGTFSAPLDESTELWNIIIGDEQGVRPSSSVFVRVQLASQGAIYDGKAVVSLDVTSRGRKISHQVFRKSLGVFGADGKQYVGFWLPETGCEDLTLVAKIANSSVSAHIPFECGE